jgi:hypothetical protein
MLERTAGAFVWSLPKAASTLGRFVFSRRRRRQTFHPPVGPLRHRLTFLSVCTISILFHHLCGPPDPR